MPGRREKALERQQQGTSRVRQVSPYSYEGGDGWDAAPVVPAGRRRTVVEPEHPGRVTQTVIVTHVQVQVLYTRYQDDPPLTQERILQDLDDRFRKHALLATLGPDSEIMVIKEDLVPYTMQGQKNYTTARMNAHGQWEEETPDAGPDADPYAGLAPEDDAGDAIDPEELRQL